jgi:hypothetical protein
MGNVDWGEVITELVKVLLPVVLMWLVGVVGVLVTKVTPWVVAKVSASLTSDQIAQVKALAGIAVNYAEQVWARPDIQDLWTSKKKLAEDYVNKALVTRGIKVTAKDIEAMIEAAVYSELNKGKALTVQSSEVTLSPGTVESVPVQPVIVVEEGGE